MSESEKGTRKRSRRHHYVPKLLLENFGNERGKLWCSRQGETRVFEASVLDAFVQKDLHTHFEVELDPDSRELRRIPDDKPDRELGRLQSRAAPALGKLIRGTRAFMKDGDAGSFRGLNASDIMACKEFFASIAYGSPQAMNEALEDIVDDARNQIANAEDASEYPSHVLNAFVETIMHTAMADHASSAHRYVPYDYDDFGLALIANSKPKSSFIVGSYGVADQLLLPIAPDIAIGFQNENRASMLLYRDLELLRGRANRWLAENSTLIAGHSRKLVQKYACVLVRSDTGISVDPWVR